MFFKFFLDKHRQVSYPFVSYSGVTSMTHMKLGDIRFAKTVYKWT